MRKTLGEIAKLIDGKVSGDKNTVITGVCGIKEAQNGDITFVANPKYAALARTTKASAVIASYDVEIKEKPAIQTENPSLAFAKMISLASPVEIKHPSGIHPTAIISKKAKLGKDVAVAAYSVIEDDVEIGDKTIIYPSCFIGCGTKIGRQTIIYPLVSIRERITIGNNVIIHSGTVIGCDGFGFAAVKGVHHKIPQIGTVVIGDNVEIGANVTIDRARFDKTVIGAGTKIDNLVQIAHNVCTGKNCIIVAQAGISGSTTIGNDVILAGQVGLVGHINVGDGAVIAAQSGVSKSVPPHTMMFGYPAKPHNIARRVNACVQRLPETHKKIQALEKKIEQLEKALRKNK